MTNLISLAEIKDFLSIKTANTDEDGRLANIAIQVSSLATSYCGREFLANNYTEYFDGGISSVFISNPPLNRVDEVSHFDGKDYQILGGPGSSGEPIIVEGQSHTINNNGNAQLKTRVKKFNRSSGRFDGASYLSVNSSDDWDLGVDSFTIEMQVRFDSVSSGKQTLISSGSATNYWELFVDFDSYGLGFKTIGSSIETINVAQSVTSAFFTNQFEHVALVRNGSSFNIYKNGVSVASLNSSANIPNFGTGINIARGVPSNYFIGYLDDLKISHIAEYTSAFVAPTNPTRIDENTKLLLRFDGTNNSTTFADVSRRVNEYTYYSVTGEISFNTGDGGGTPKLGFFRPLQFYNYPNGVRVYYNGGFSSVPEDLKLAILEMVKVIYKGKSGTESMRFQGESSTSHKLSVDDFPPQVRRVLNLYRLIE
jgi:hypothetical protein